MRPLRRLGSVAAVSRCARRELSSRGRDADAVREFGAQRVAQRNRPRGGSAGDRGPRTTGLEAKSGAVVWDATVTDPRPLNFGYVRDDTKNAIYALRREDPATWTYEALADREQLPVNRIKAILMLKDLEQDARDAAGDEGLIGDGLQALFEEKAATFLKELSQKYKVTVKNSGHREAKVDAALPTSTRLEILMDEDDEAAALARASEKLDAAKARAAARDEEKRAAALALATAPRAADAAKPGAFAFRDLDDPTKPTRIVQPDAGAAARDADADEETQRSWTRKPAYWDIHARKRLRDADSS